MITMFDQLLSLPMFRGVSKARLSEVVGKVKLHFLKFPAGETIIRAGEECTHLAFVLSGQVRLTAVNSNGRFIIGQTVSAPAVISPDFIFGRITTYPSTVVALNTVSILKISKQDFVDILYSDHVFMLNYLNTISVNAQKALSGLLSLTDGSLDQRIAFWVIALTQPGSEDIRLTCRSRDLCTIFGVQRSTFEATAAAMKAAGLITYTPREICIVNRREMLNILEGSSESHEDSPD